MRLTLLIILMIAVGCKEAETFSRSQKYPINDLPLLKEGLSRYFPDRHVETFLLAEPNVGRWFVFGAENEEVARFLEGKKVEGQKLEALVSSGAGDISKAIQFRVPSELKYGWSHETIRIPCRFGGRASYMFYDPLNKRIVMCVFR